MNTLHTKHRPSRFEDVVGNKATVDSVSRHLLKGTQRAFLFHGEPGTGKTTISRLVKETVGAIDADCFELNAGADTGVDTARELVDMARYRGMGPKGVRVFILDEVQMLSRNAWNALLKAVEDGGDWVYWCFCTTEVRKVPKAMVSRCAVYAMEWLDVDSIVVELRRIAKAEEMNVGGNTLTAVAAGSDGCMRAAITTLADIAGVTDEDTIKDMCGGIATGVEGDAITLCRTLMKARLFSELQPDLKALSSVRESEGIRRVIVAYFSKVAIGARSRDVFFKAAAVLDAFGTAYGVDAGVGPLVVSCRNFLVSVQGKS